ncbi:MAG: archease, partial [Chloroflexi bacterium]|nr:archease [Chloroflexota bacterium]
PRTIAEDICREVEVKATDWGALLVEWLNELLFIFDTEQLLLRRFQVLELNDQKLRANCFGERVVPQRHHLKLAIKAATYHQLQVEVGDPCRVQVILDI